jgi:TDG/mug DNA glycosylase family protein
MPDVFSRRPTRDELVAARGRAVPDIIAPELKVLFCGINPGLYSGAVGHHFARPGNRFWKALFQAGFTDRLLAPCEEHLLPGYGCGITNIVNRATAQAAELSVDELREGASVLERKALAFRPRTLAVLGIDAYRKAFEAPAAAIGLQSKKIGATAVWVLPNPSGINAGYRMEEIVRLFSELRAATKP